MHTHRRATAIITVMCLLSACRQQHSQQQTQTPARKSAEAPDNPSAIPASIPPDNAVPNSVADVTSAASARLISVRAVIAHLPTEYSASFSADHLNSITETRSVEGRQVRGVYEFYGARLTRYFGESLHEARIVQLELDLQGIVVSNTAALSGTDVEELKTRAQLLRSHALAQQASRSH